MGVQADVRFRAGAVVCQGSFELFSGQIFPPTHSNPGYDPPGSDCGDGDDQDQDPDGQDGQDPSRGDGQDSQDNGAEDAGDQPSGDGSRIMAPSPRGLVQIKVPTDEVLVGDLDFPVEAFDGLPAGRLCEDQNSLILAYDRLLARMSTTLMNLRNEGPSGAWDCLDLLATGNYASSTSNVDTSPSSSETGRSSRKAELISPRDYMTARAEIEAEIQALQKSNTESSMELAEMSEQLAVDLPYPVPCRKNHGSKRSRSLPTYGLRSSTPSNLCLRPHHAGLNCRCGFSPPAPANSPTDSGYETISPVLSPVREQILSPVNDEIKTVESSDSDGGRRRSAGAKGFRSAKRR